MRTYIVTLAFLSLTAGCGSEGMRAGSNECPSGEVCSPNEPGGPATITATAGGQSTTITVEVILPPAPSSSRLLFGRGATLQPGLRALAAQSRADAR